MPGTLLVPSIKLEGCELGMLMLLIGVVRSEEKKLNKRDVEMGKGTLNSFWIFSVS
jgi:hypothetical protein